MLGVAPKSWLSWCFVVSRDRWPIAELDLAWAREKGELDVEGKKFSVYREGLMSGAFVLEDRDGVLARAVKPSALFREFAMMYRGEEYVLRAAGVFSRAFILYKEGREVGDVRPEGFFTRKARVQFPDGLPLAVQIFLIWLVVILWRRQARAAAD